MTSARRAFVTPPFDVSDPVVCHSISLRPSLWTVVWFLLQDLGSEWSWRQDDPTNATVSEVVEEIRKATDTAIFWGCTMIGDVKWIARTEASFELLCDGSSYLREDYPDLYAVLDPAYIVDADNFVVPDLMDRFALGSDTTGIEGGNDEITLTEGQLAPHVHTDTITGVSAADPILGVPLPVASVATPSTTGSAGSGDPISIINPYHTLRPVIIAAYPTAG